jgi:hypothetical protein
MNEDRYWPTSLGEKTVSLCLRPGAVWQEQLIQVALFIVNPPDGACKWIAVTPLVHHTPISVISISSSMLVFPLLVLSIIAAPCVYRLWTILFVAPSHPYGGMWELTKAKPAVCTLAQWFVGLIKWVNENYPRRDISPLRTTCVSKQTLIVRSGCRLVNNIYCKAKTPQSWDEQPCAKAAQGKLEDAVNEQWWFTKLIADLIGSR